MRGFSVFLISILALLLTRTPTAARSDGFIQRGTVNDASPFEEVLLRVDEDNSLLRITMLPTSGDLDTLLYLVDQRGTIVAENDDRSRTGASSGSYIEFAQAAAGEYRIIATRYNVSRGKTSGDFELSVEILPGTARLPDYDLSDAALLAAGFPPVEPRPEADWTILAYYGGDTNLEAGILDDFKEFELAGGSADRVRIILLMDRHPEFSQASGNWASARIFEVDEDRSGRPESSDALILDTTPLADLGDFDSGDGENFARFLAWGARSFPARNYVLALASHGAGWEGIITDYSTGNILSLPELRQALTTAQQAASIDRFALLINDACLMASVEYHTVMREAFDFSLASPEIVVNPALDMTLFAQSVKDSPAEIDLPNLGRLLINTYMQRDVAQRRASDKEFLTNALVDLNRFQSVEEAVEAFAAVINENPELHAAMLGAARQSAYVYTGFLDQNTLIDLGSFMREVVKRSSDVRVLEAAQIVLRALQASLVYSEAGERASRRIAHSYHNIYFPGSRRQLSDAYFLNTSLPEWSRMLRNYFNALTPKVWTRDNQFLFHPPVAPSAIISSFYPREKISTAWPAQIDLEIVGRKVFSVAFLADQIQSDGSSIRYAFDELTIYDDRGDPSIWASGVEQASFLWDVLIPELSDGQVAYPELASLTEDILLLEARYQAPETEAWYDIALLFGSSDGEIQSIVSRDSSSEALGVLDDLPPDSRIQIYRSLVSVDGVTERVPGNEYRWNRNSLRLNWRPAPDGLYRLGFLVRSFGGETALASVEVQVEQPDDADQVRGYTDSVNGFNLQFASDFPEPEIGDYGILSSINEAGSIGFSLIPIVLPVYSPGKENLEAMLARFEEEAFAYSIDTPTLEKFRVGESEGYTFTLIDAAGEEYQGYTVPVNEYRWLFLWLFGDPTDPDYATLESTLLQRSSVFSAEDLETERRGLWSINAYSTLPEIRIPVRRDWEATIRDEDFWLVFNGPDQRSFLRLALFEGSDAEALADRLLVEEISADGGNLTTDERRSYYGEYHNWRTTLYQIERENVSMLGRLYTMSVPDSTSMVAVWFETPAAEEAENQRIATIFEPMLDGLYVPSIVRPVRDEELGITLTVPRSWLSPQYDEDSPEITVIAADFSETLIILPAQDVATSLNDFAQIIADEYGAELEEMIPARYGGQEGLELLLRWEDEAYTAQAFVVPGIVPESFVAFLLLSETEYAQVPVEERFAQLMATLRFDGIAAEPPRHSLTSASGQGRPALQWYEDLERGFYFPIPALWDWRELVEFSESGRLWTSPSEANALLLDYFSADISPESALESIQIQPQTLEWSNIDQVDVLRFQGEGMAYTGEDSLVSGFAFTVESLNETVVISFYTMQPDSKLEALAELAFAELGFFEPVAEDEDFDIEEEESSDETRRYQKPEYNVVFEYPEEFGPFTYDAAFEGDLAYSDAGDEISVALYDAAGLELADYAAADGYEISSEFDVGGVDAALIFGEFEEDGDILPLGGILIYFPDDDAVLEILVLSSNPDTMIQVLETMLNSLSLMDSAGHTRTSARFSRNRSRLQMPPPPPPGSTTPEGRNISSAPDRFEYVDRTLGFAFAMPGGWPAPDYDPLEDRFTSSSPDGSQRLVLRVFYEEVSNLASFVQFHYPSATEILPELHPAILLASFTYQVLPDAAQSAARGLGAAFYVEQAQAAVIITLDSGAPADLSSTTAPTPLDLAFEEVLASLRLLPQEQSRPTPQMLLRQFMNSAYGFTIEYPLIWDNMRFDTETQWFVSLSEGTTEALYIYVVTEHAGTLESVIDTVIGRGRMQITSEPQPAQIAGIEGLEFDVTYKYNGIWVGRCIAVLHRGVGLIFSLELMSTPEDAERLFDLFANTVTLLP